MSALGPRSIGATGKTGAPARTQTRLWPDTLLGRKGLGSGRLGVQKALGFRGSERLGVPIELFHTAGHKFPALRAYDLLIDRLFEAVKAGLLHAKLHLIRPVLPLLDL
jgi:hypothetical protein